MNKHLFLISVGLLLNLCVKGQNLRADSKWDMNLLPLELKMVHIQAKSLSEAWQLALAGQLGVRTVLYKRPADQEPFQNAKFIFDSEKCTVSDVIKAFENTYQDYTHTQDKKTGIIWLHPQAIAYESILTNKIQLAKNARALPMQTEILEKLRPFKIYNGGSGGEVMLNTFNFPVDLDAGTYAVRDILNLGCRANPNRTFFVGEQHNKICMIFPSVVVPWNKAVPTAIALSYWQTEVDAKAQALPSDAELVSVLTSNDAHRRTAARNYVGLNLATYFSRMGDLQSKADSWQKSVWVSLATLNLVANSESDEPLHLPETDRMEKALKEKDWSDNLGLKALVAMELARVKKNSTYLKQVASQPLSASEIASVEPDMNKILRYSVFVRTNLLALNPQWAGFARSDIENLGNTNIFILP